MNYPLALLGVMFNEFIVFSCFACFKVKTATAPISRRERQSLCFKVETEKASVLRAKRKSLCFKAKAEKASVLRLKANKHLF